MTLGKETEYKLEVGELQLLDCILCDRVITEKMTQPYAYIRMQTTYYDTEEELLGSRRWMLRLRTENERSVVTMKTPAEGHTRAEWEIESAYLDEALPKLVALGAPELVGQLDAQALLPVCGAQYTRITACLQLSEHTSCHVCGDVGELQADGRRELLCELELELAEGSEAELAEYVRALAEKYHLAEQPRSKAQRARTLREQADRRAGEE